MSGVEILLSDSRGIYIPRDFANFDHSIGSWGIKEDDEDLKILREGPEAEWYWEAWTEILDKASFTDSKGNTWRLYQDGDLFAYCEELMTAEEKRNLFDDVIYFDET